MPERDGERWDGVERRAVKRRQVGAGEVMTETAVGKEIPYFIWVRGCNNCRVFKSYTSLTGTEYGTNHRLHAKCVHMGCDRYGYNVLSPFITPKEFLRIGINTGLRRQAVERARKVVARFREFYDTRGGLRPWVVEEISQQDPPEG
jgi:hypothetical protein